MRRRQLAIAGLLLTATACQEVEQPKTVLTQEQWSEVKQHILTEEPAPKYKVGAKFGDKIEFIGFDVDGPLQAGKATKFTWYWRALEDVGENWKVFVHLDSNVAKYRGNLDHTPVGGLYDTSRWQKGQIIRDIQEVTLKADFPPGKATPYIGLFRGSSRMQLVNDVPKTKEPQPRVIGPTLMVMGPKGETKAAPKPRPKMAIKVIKHDQAPPPTIDGKIDDAVWGRISPVRLSPFGNAPQNKSWVKAYVDEENLWVAARLEDGHVWGNFDKRDDETWKEEVLEMFLDVDGDGKNYMELQITPKNTIFDAKFATRLGTGEGSREDQINAAKAWNIEGLESAVFVEGTLNNADDQDQAWSVELKIPAKQIPGLEQTGVQLKQEWALNFYRFDRPKDGVSHAWAWSTGPQGDFHEVSKFGTGLIVDASAVKRPQVTPEMLKQMRKNIDLKVRPDPGSIKAPAPPFPPSAEDLKKARAPQAPNE